MLGIFFYYAIFCTLISFAVKTEQTYKSCTFCDYLPYYLCTIYFDL